MINIAEILKDYPKGTKLYSPIFGEVYLDKIRPYLAIVVTTDKEQGNFKEEFLYDGKYGMNGECMLFPSKDQRDWNKFQRPFKDDEWNLVPNKFDINTLKTFDKVLVRDSDLQKWFPALWGYYDFENQNYPYKLVGDVARYCIPYEENKHLLGTTDDCDEYYKNW